ncbi:hypothetical protein V8C35DRAFT_297400 [Trichoderma chlorosporum]
MASDRQLFFLAILQFWIGSSVCCSFVMCFPPSPLDPCADVLCLLPTLFCFFVAQVRNLDDQSYSLRICRRSALEVRKLEVREPSNDERLSAPAWQLREMFVLFPP